MNKISVRNPWLIVPVFGMISIGIMLLLIYLNSVHYLGVFNLRWPVYLCLVAPVFLAMSYANNDRVKGRMAVRAIAFLMPLMAAAIFQIYKPAYDVQAAINKIEATSPYEVNVQSHDKPGKTRAAQSRNRWLTSAYIFDISRENDKMALIFYPDSGEYSHTSF